MAAHSSILAWEIRWTEEPVELYSIRSQKTGIQFRTQFSSIQLLTHIQLFAIPQTVARQASLSITNSGSLLKLMSIESIMPSNHLILCRPLLLPPSILKVRLFLTLNLGFPCYLLWPPDAKNWLIWKDPDAGKDWRWEETGMTEEEIVWWHHQLNGHEFE